MTKHELADIADHQLEIAKASPNGRSAEVLVGDDEGIIQHTVVALTAGNVVSARESTEHSTLQILSGAVRVRTSDGSEDIAAGDLVEVPSDPHVIRAEQDTTALLTESKSDAGGWDAFSA